MLTRPWPPHWSSVPACDWGVLWTKSSGQAPCKSLSFCLAPRSHSSLQTWPHFPLGWMMWQHAALCKRRVEVQLRWSNSSKIMFLYWFTWMLLYSVFCFKIVQFITVLLCEQERKTCFPSLLIIFVVIVMLVTQNLFPLKGFLFYATIAILLNESREEQCDTEIIHCTQTCMGSSSSQLLWWKTENKGQFHHYLPHLSEWSKNGDRSNRLSLFSE